MIARLRCPRGQGMSETMVWMTFVLLMVMGFIHFCMLAATKSMVNLAAFSAARTLMVQDGTEGTGAPSTPWTPHEPNGITDALGMAPGMGGGGGAGGGGTGGGGGGSSAGGGVSVQEFNQTLPKRLAIAWVAAWQVLDNIRWYRNEEKNAPDKPLHLAVSAMPNPLSANGTTMRLGLTVTYHAPIGVRLFYGRQGLAGASEFGGGRDQGIAVTAFAPIVIQNVPEEGDNAR